MATLRESMKQGITAAIAAGSAPRPPSKGRGLMLAIDGQRRGLRLMDDRGDLTAAGDYYYEAMGVAPPNKRFDYTQEPTAKNPDPAPRRDSGDRANLGQRQPSVALHARREKVLRGG